MTRPSSRCFLFEMEHIKLVCFSDKCLILNPDDKATENFINGLSIVGKKRDPGILDPEPFLAQIRKVEARLGKLAKIRKVETD